jgi:hypothetical protein
MRTTGMLAAAGAGGIGDTGGNGGNGGNGGRAIDGCRREAGIDHRNNDIWPQELSGARRVALFGCSESN